MQDYDLPGVEEQGALEVADFKGSLGTAGNGRAGMVLEEDGGCGFDTRLYFCCDRGRGFITNSNANMGVTVHPVAVLANSSQDQQDLGQVQFSTPRFTRPHRPADTHLTTQGQPQTPAHQGAPAFLSKSRNIPSRGNPSQDVHRQQKQLMITHP